MLATQERWEILIPAPGEAADQMIRTYSSQCWGGGDRQISEVCLSTTSACLMASVRNPISKKQGDGFWGSKPEVDFWLLCVYEEVWACACRPHTHSFSSPHIMQMCKIFCMDSYVSQSALTFMSLFSHPTFAEFMCFKWLTACKNLC